MSKSTTTIISRPQRPSAFQRLRAAVKFYRRGWTSTDIIAPGDSKRMPFIWPSYRTGAPMWHLVDFENYAQDGFERNALIYSAIMYKARSFTIAPLRAYKGTPTDSEELAPDAPLAKLCNRPNPFMGWGEFAILCSVYFNLAGNCYIYVDRTRAAANGGVPTALWPMRPDRISIVPKRTGGRTTDVIGYIYIPESGDLHEGIPFLPADMMHVKLPNPLDPLDGLGEGLSPIAPMAQSGDVDNAITRYLKLFFERGAMPSGMMSYDMPLQPEDVARIKERWVEVYGGVDNWTDLLVADNAGKYQRLSMSFNEMGFEGLDNRNEARIMAPFGVPPILIGTKLGLTSATYSNYELARRAFWEDTMLPEIGLFETEFRYYLQSDAGEFVAFDYSEVPGLKQDATQTAGIAQMAFQAGAITRNEYRLQIGMDRVDDGDVYLLNPMLQTVPVGTTPEMMWLPPGPRPREGGESNDTSEGAPAADDEMESQEGKAKKASSPA